MEAEPVQIAPAKSKEVFQWKSMKTKQNRNTIKFMMRIFLKYHTRFDENTANEARISEIENLYERLYGGQQGKINLLIYK